MSKKNSNCKISESVCSLTAKSHNPDYNFKGFLYPFSMRFCMHLCHLALSLTQTPCSCNLIEDKTMYVLFEKFKDPFAGKMTKV